MLMPVPVVVFTVLPAPVTLTVPPPAEEKAVFGPVSRLSPPRKLIVVPELLSKLIPGVTKQVTHNCVIGPPNVSVPPVLFWISIELKEGDAPTTRMARPRILYTGLSQVRERITRAWQGPNPPFNLGMAQPETQRF